MSSAAITTLVTNPARPGGVCGDHPAAPQRRRLDGGLVGVKAREQPVAEPGLNFDFRPQVSYIKLLVSVPAIRYRSLAQSNIFTLYTDDRPKCFFRLYSVLGYP